jgi:hypothetical protein
MQHLELCDDVYHVHPTTVSDEVFLKLIFLQKWRSSPICKRKNAFQLFTGKYMYDRISIYWHPCTQRVLYQCQNISEAAIVWFPLILMPQSHTIYSVLYFWSQGPAFDIYFIETWIHVSKCLWYHSTNKNYTWSSSYTYSHTNILWSVKVTSVLVALKKCLKKFMCQHEHWETYCKFLRNIFMYAFLLVKKIPYQEM